MKSSRSIQSETISSASHWWDMLSMHSYPPRLISSLTVVSSCYKTPSPLPCNRYIQKPVRQAHSRVITNSPLPSMACINSTFQSCSIARGAKITTRGTRGSSGGKGSPTFQCRASTFVDAASLRLELDENPEAIISRVWPENVSLLNYDDLRAYLESQETAQVDDQHVTLLGETMSTPVLVATADQTLEEVECHFEAVSGLPVVDSSLRCLGVVVKNDRARASHGSKTKVSEVMTSPAITLSSDKTVMDAAVLMLKMKIHRLPVVNQDEQVIGIVTRADVIHVLEGMLKI